MITEVKSAMKSVNCTYYFHIRNYQHKTIFFIRCIRISRLYYNNKEPFHNMFFWIDTARALESEFALSAENVRYFQN